METENKMNLLAHEAFSLADVVSSIGRAVNIENDPECKVNIGFVGMTEHKDMRGGTAMLELEVKIGPHDSPLLIKKRACENLEKRRRGQINDIRNCTEKLAEIGRELNSVISQVSRIGKKCCRSEHKCRCEAVTDQLDYVTTKRARQSQDRARSSSRNRGVSRGNSPRRRSSSRGRDTYRNNPKARCHGGYYGSSGYYGPLLNSRAPSKSRNRSVSREPKAACGRSPVRAPGGREVREYSTSPDRRDRIDGRDATPQPDAAGQADPPRPTGEAGGQAESEVPPPVQPARTVVLVDEEDRGTDPATTVKSLGYETLSLLAGAPPTPLDYEPAEVMMQMEVDRTPGTEMSWDPTDLEESLQDYDLELFASIDDQSIRNVESVASVETLPDPGPHSQDVAQPEQADPVTSKSAGAGPGTSVGDGPTAPTAPAEDSWPKSGEHPRGHPGAAEFWPGSSERGARGIEAAKKKINMSARDLSNFDTVLTVEMLHARYSYSCVLMRFGREFTTLRPITIPEINHSQLVTEARNLDRSRVYKVCLSDTMNQFRGNFAALGWRPIDSNRVLSREILVRVRVAEIIVMQQLEKSRVDATGKARHWDAYMSKGNMLDRVNAAFRIAGVNNTTLEDEEYCLPDQPEHVRDQVQQLRAIELLRHLVHSVAVRCGDRMQGRATTEQPADPAVQPGADSWLLCNEFRVGLKRGVAVSEMGGLNILLPTLTRLQGGLYL